MNTFGLNTVKKLYKVFKNKVINSIAFYPVVLSLLFLVIAFTILYVENLDFIDAIKEKVPYLIVNDKDIAKTILSTLFGGILSLTVFSFTMVMVVLNQASSNFSPRLLPSLISNKRHQIILGFYIGTLQYCIILLISMGSYVNKENNGIGFSVMIASIMGAFCIALFVYFIHSISQAVQIHNITDRIYSITEKLLTKEYKKQLINSVPLTITNSSKNWQIIKSPKSGYYQGFDLDLITTELKDAENFIEIIPYPDQHIWKNAPIAKIKNHLKKEQIKQLLFGFFILSNKHDKDSGIGGMIKLTEIAVKAMSPGINDPGTAINAISKLGQLLEITLQMSIKSINYHKKTNITITQNNPLPKEIMRIIVQPIRQYCKQDFTVSHSLLKMLLFLKGNLKNSNGALDAIETEISLLWFDLKEHSSNKDDLRHLIQQTA